MAETPDTDMLQQLLRMQASERAEKLHRESPRRRAQNISMGVGVPTALAGGALSAVSGRIGNLAREHSVISRPGIDALGAFARSMTDTASDPTKFMQNYIAHGSGMMGRRLRGGETGYDFMRQLYNSPGFNLAGSLAGAKDMKWSPQKMRHYRSFARGPLTAYLRMTQEVGGAPEIQRGLASAYRSAVGESAFEAAKAIGAADLPQDASRLLHKNPEFLKEYKRRLTSKLKNTEFSSLAGDKLNRFVDVSTRRLSRTEDFNRLLWAHAGGDSAGVKSLEGGLSGLLEPSGMDRTLRRAVRSDSEVVRALGGRDAISKLSAPDLIRRLADRKRVPVEVQQRLVNRLVSSNDPLLAAVRNRVHAGWSTGPAQHYSLLSGAASKYQNVLNVLRKGSRAVKPIGQAGLIGGTALAGLGLLGRLTQRRPRVLERQVLRAPEPPPVPSVADTPSLLERLRSYATRSVLGKEAGDHTMSNTVKNAASGALALRAPQVGSTLSRFVRSAPSATAGAASSTSRIQGLFDTLRSFYAKNIQGTTPGRLADLMRSKARKNPGGALGSAAGAGVLGGVGLTGVLGGTPEVEIRTMSDKKSFDLSRATYEPPPPKREGMSPVTTGAIVGGVGSGLFLGTRLGDIIRRLVLPGKALAIGAGGAVLGGGMAAILSKLDQLAEKKSSDKHASVSPSISLQDVLHSIVPGVAAGGTLGSGYGAVRGQTADDMVRGGVRGAFTGGGATLGTMLGSRYGENLENPTHQLIAKILGGTLGGLGGYALSRLIRRRQPQPQGQEKLNEEKKAFYCCVGNRVVVTSGEKAGKIGTCTKVDRSTTDLDYIDDDGAKVTKRKEDCTVTVKFKDGTTQEFDSPDGTLKEYYGDNDDTDSEYASKSSGTECLVDGKAAFDNIGVEEEKVASEGQPKLAAVLERVINGDTGLEQIIERLKTAKSKAKKKSGKGKSGGCSK